jgi:hypothetical protein
MRVGFLRLGPLLESVPEGCSITGISVSSRTNSAPGQPDCLYGSALITMQVERK